MTCPRAGCAGLVIRELDPALIGFPVYCINCGWRGCVRDLSHCDNFLDPVNHPALVSEGMRKWHRRMTDEQRAAWRARVSEGRRKAALAKLQHASAPPSASST